MPPETHIVVLDVCVLLDVASLVGEPFTWDKFSDLAAKHARDPVPHPRDRRIDSLRAVAVCLSGRFAGQESLEVWTSAHIDDLLVRKAAQSADASLVAEARGLGWSQAGADDLLQDLLYEVVFDRSGGGSAGANVLSRDAPPLEHEDGKVYGTACESGDGLGLVRYCITADKRFRLSSPDLSGDVVVLYPGEWVSLVQQSRRTLAMAALRP